VTAPTAAQVASAQARQEIATRAAENLGRARLPRRRPTRWGTPCKHILTLLDQRAGGKL
jgi:hypothetical protein